MIGRNSHFSINNLEKKRILQKLREPKILGNSRLGFSPELCMVLDLLCGTYCRVYFCNYLAVEDSLRAGCFIFGHTYAFILNGSSLVLQVTNLSHINNIFNVCTFWPDPFTCYYCIAIQSVL